LLDTVALLRSIEVGTPVSPDAPLADPGVRNYRTGLLKMTRKWSQREHSVSEPPPECKQGA
jgi:hypothetical protein